MKTTRFYKVLSPIVALLLLASSLASCSTKTLVNFNVDADSFIPATTKSGSLIVTASIFQYRFPDDDGDAVNGNDLDGAIIAVPSVKFITKASLSLKLTINTSATGSLEVYVAPGNVANIYQAQYRVLQAATTDSSSFAGSVTLSAASGDPAQTQAFAAIQSGGFRVGAQVRGSAAIGETVQYSVDDLTVSVAGYPIKAVF